MGDLKNIAILASGSGTNAEQLVKHFKKNDGLRISHIISNKNDAGVLERAKRLGIPNRSFSSEELRGESFADWLRNEGVDGIVLAGYLLKIPESLIHAYPDRIVNIHPALLPSYGGKGMYGMHVHNAVIGNNEEKSGITIHLVNENYDEGRHLFQASLDIQEGETPESLAKRIHELEHAHFPVVVENYFRTLFEV